MNKFIATVSFLGLMSFNSAFAESNSQAVTENPKNPDPVYVFNRICYTQVHDVDAIQEMAAKLGWRALDDDEVEHFKSYENPTALLGWDVQVGERLFKVGLVKGGLQENMKSLFPDFKDGSATSCSLVLDEEQDANEFLPNMQLLAGKDPVSSDVPEGSLRTTTWAGGNTDLKVFLFAKAPPSKKGGMLNVTIISK